MAAEALVSPGSLAEARQSPPRRKLDLLTSLLCSQATPSQRPTPRGLHPLQNASEAAGWGPGLWLEHSWGFRMLTSWL